LRSFGIDVTVLAERVFRRMPPARQSRSALLVNRRPVAAVSGHDSIGCACICHRKKEQFMKSRLLIAAGIVIVIVGVFWALQGFGVIGGSFMSGNQTFKVVGPLVALVGLALAAVGLRRRGSASP
jgi:hypothetical protein